MHNDIADIIGRASPAGFQAKAECLRTDKKSPPLEQAGKNAVQVSAGGENLRMSIEKSEAAGVILMLVSQYMHDMSAT